MKISVKRMGAGNYAVLADGKHTRITIIKGDPPRFGNPQMWEAAIDDDPFWAPTQAPSMRGVAANLQGIIDALGVK